MMENLQKRRPKETKKLAHFYAKWVVEWIFVKKNDGQRGFDLLESTEGTQQSLFAYLCCQG